MNTVSLPRKLGAIIALGSLAFGSPSAWAGFAGITGIADGNQGSGHANWGPIESQDSATQFTVDGGVTWKDAYIVEKHPAYSNPISGTRYINSEPSVFLGTGQTVRYRTIIWADCVLSIHVPVLKSLLVHSDDAATVYLNGDIIGQHPNPVAFENFQDPPDDFINNASFAIPAPGSKLLRSGGPNVLEFEVADAGFFATALDYKAITACVSKPK